MKQVLASFVAALGLCLSVAHAENFPTRPITIIVPFAAGGPVDTTTRIVADKMKDLLGQPVLIENVGGAAGVGRRARRTSSTRRLHAGNAAFSGVPMSQTAQFTS